MSAPIILTPGVYFNEIDISQYIKILSSCLLAVVGVASRGVVNADILITTGTQAVNKLGIPSETYPALKVVQNFFAAGGAICHFVRVTNGADVAATAVVNNIDGSTMETLTASETGSFFNDMAVVTSYGSQVPESVTGSTLLTASTPHTQTLAHVPIVPGTVQIKWNNVVVGKDDGHGNLTFVVGGTLAGATSATVNYNTGVLAFTPAGGFSTGTHVLLINYNAFTTFNLQLLLTVLDNNSNVVKEQVIEAFSGLTLANYVAQLANAVNIEAPGSAPTTFPLAGSVDFSGGDDGADMIDDSEFVGNSLGGSPTGLQVFANPDAIDINTVCIPGNSSNAVSEAVVELCSTQRGDCVGIIDPPSDATVTTVADWANATGGFSSNQVINSNYVALYFPWYSSTNNITNSVDLTPPSAAAIQAFAKSQDWQAPAGPNRGIIGDFAGISIALSPGDRLFLGNNRINPLSNLKGLGTMVLGQQTATLTASSLDRLGARRMLLNIEKSTGTAMYTFLMEANDQQTWTRVVNLIQPYLDSLVNASQIYAGVIYCDAVTNTVENVNNNIMTAYIVLQLLKYAEIIVLNFETTAFGTTISEALISAAPAGTL